MKKRGLSAIIAAVLLMACMCVTAFAGTDDAGGAETYAIYYQNNVNSGEVRFSVFAVDWSGESPQQLSLASGDKITDDNMPLGVQVINESSKPVVLTHRTMEGAIINRKIIQPGYASGIFFDGEDYVLDADAKFILGPVPPLTLKGFAPEFSASYCAGTYNSETGAVTVKYSGAAGDYISAIVTNSTGGTIKTYDWIAPVTGADGEITINTSDKMDEGDRLFVFCEQYNEEDAADYASDLKEITIPPAGHVWKDATCTEAAVCTVCGAAGEAAKGHSFVYALSEDQKTITAACSAENCPSGYHENGFVVTLNAPEKLVYDGTAKEAVISGYPDSAVPQLADKPNIVYYKSTGEGSTEPDGDALAGAPKDAGNYVAQITWGEKTAGAAFTITKTAAQITAAPSASAITYGQTLKDSTLSGGQAGVPGTFAWKDSTKAPAVSDSDKTEYDVVFTPDDTDNYDTAECKVTVTVNKADASVTAAPEATNPAWTGTAQKLVSKGTAEDGEMKYALGADDKTVPEGGWSADVPEAADPNTYFIWYKAAGDENHNDSEAACVTSNITAKLISYTVTFKVENGAWNDKTAKDKKVTLSRYENEDKALVLNDGDIPAVGNEPAEHYKEGSWDVTPDTETEIKEDTTYTYTYVEKAKISKTVTFKVVNGAWNDEKTEDVTVTLNGEEGDVLKLSADQIPAAGNKPAEHYKEGSWDVMPSTETEIKDNPTYTYTYAQKPVYKVIEGANGKVQKGSGNGLNFKTDGDYGKFTGIKIDSTDVISSMYDSKSGSTIVTLKSSLIDKLEAGNHSIEFLYTDGSCGTEFEVQAAAAPTKTPTPSPTNTPAPVKPGETAVNTGDPNSMGSWMALITVSVLGIGIALFARRKSKR